MRTIALTGQPQAQEAVELYLRGAINGRALPIRVLAGLMQRTEAYAVHAEGGEVWLCGPNAPQRDLVGLIDRVLPADTVLNLGTQTVQCLDEFLSKTNLSGEPA